MRHLWSIALHSSAKKRNELEGRVGEGGRWVELAAKDAPESADKRTWMLE